MKKKISVVLPCQNEIEAISDCIDIIRKTAKRNKLNVEIMVSDSSKDGSDKVAISKRVKLVKHDKDGYGIAIKEGIKASSGEIIVFADCDATYDFKQLPKLLKKLDNNPDSIIIGSRLNGKISKGAMPPLHRYVGVPLINLALKLLGVEVSDSQSGFRAFKREIYDKLKIKSNGMDFATEMLVKAKQKKVPVIEVPINYLPRKGYSKLKTYRDGWSHFRYILLRIKSLK